MIYPPVTRKGRGAIHRTNLNLLRSCICFLVFRLSFFAEFFSLLNIGFHRAGIIIVRFLNQKRNNEEAWW